MFEQSTGVNNSFVGDNESSNQSGFPKISQNISIVNNFHQEPKKDQPPPYDQKKDPDPVLTPPRPTTPPSIPLNLPQVKHYLGLSCVVLWLINILFGLIAFCLACDSKHAADSGLIRRGRRLGRAALAVNIIGILVTITIIVVVLLWHYDVINIGNKILPQNVTNFNGTSFNGTSFNATVPYIN